MPEWMMDYCASIGEESFSDYRGLAAKYQFEINRYLKSTLPNQKQNNQVYKPLFKPTGWGKTIEESKRKEIDPRPRIYSIEERYKKEALNIACKYGYERPKELIAQFDDKLTDYQENSSQFSRALTDEDKKAGNSPEDAIAQYAHQQYFKKNPKAKEQFETTKEDLRRLEYEEQHPDPFNHPYQSANDEKALKEKLINEKLDKFLNNFNSPFKITDKEKGKEKDVRDKDMDDR